jgi:hypothetical protein
LAKKPPRKDTPDLTVLKVLDQSRRRCALCFYLEGDLSQKLGQIAHLDDDRTNSAEDNLAFLCLKHHSEYDTETSQHKGYTMLETKEARRQLYNTIEEGRHNPGFALAGTTSQKEADRQTLQRLLTVLPSAGSILFIKQSDFGAAYRQGNLDELRQFKFQCCGVEHEFIDAQLETLRTELERKITAFLTLLDLNSFPVNDHAEVYRVPQERHKHDNSAWKEIKPVIDSINNAADHVIIAYNTLVRKGRERLG